MHSKEITSKVKLSKAETSKIFTDAPQLPKKDQKVNTRFIPEAPQSRTGFPGMDIKNRGDPRLGTFLFQKNSKAETRKLPTKSTKYSKKMKSTCNRSLRIVHTDPNTTCAVPRRIIKAATIGRASLQASVGRLTHLRDSWCCLSM